MKIVYNLILVVIVVAVFGSCVQGITITPGLKSTDSAAIRIIGYLRDDDVVSGDGIKFNFSKINYLNIAFINPDQHGNFASLEGLAGVVTTAHLYNVKVLASIGGGLAPAYYSTLLAGTQQAALINKLVQFAVTNHLDGIDVDLEGVRIDQNYQAFVTGLSAALKQKNKLLTAAVATIYGSQYTDKALAALDLVNIMSYDKTGPWNPDNPGPHAPYNMAVDDLAYWGQTRGIAKKKLNLGLPFYGYGFGKNAPAEITFKSLVAKYPGAQMVDSVTLTGGGIIYYNGIPTIKSKTKLAIQKAGGVMIWQLLQDAGGDNSLLNAVKATIKTGGQ